MMKIDFDQNIDLEFQKLTAKDSLENNQQSEHTIDTQKTSKLKFSYQEYEKAIQSLQEYSYPTTIPCRENQKDVIMKFIVQGFEEKGRTSTLYISGFPGVGKTIVVRDTIQRFSQRNKKRRSEFLDIHINAMNLMKPHAIYSSILKQITGLEVSGCKALPTLNQILSRGQFPKQLHKDATNYCLKNIEKSIKKTKIIFIDEVDYLFTKDEDVLYNIFEWTHSPHSKLVLITSSNTFTFPEQLQQKILSRIGSQRLNFMTYTSAQIELILYERLKQLDIFEKTGIRLMAKKLATTSDMRKCLYILRSCIQNYVELKNIGEIKRDFIKIDDINRSIRQMYDNPLINSLKGLPKVQVTVLKAILDVIKQTGIYCWMSELISQLNSKTKNHKKQGFQSSVEIQQTVARLKEMNILKMSMRQRHNRKSLTANQIPTHVSQFRIELIIQTTAIQKALDLI